MNDSQPKSRQGEGADPADAVAGSSPEANVSGGGSVEGLDTGVKDADGGDGSGGGGGGSEKAAEDRGLEGGGDGGGGDNGEGDGGGGGEEGAETMEPHGKAEEVRLSKNNS